MFHGIENTNTKFEEIVTCAFKDEIRIWQIFTD